jgi:hypothetical protein
MKIQGLLVLICLLLLGMCVNAQIVTGKVTDADSGKPIANASIYLNGTSRGTTSDAAGAFKITINQPGTPLIISCVGYQSQTVGDYSTGNLTIALKAKQMALAEVVIGGMNREEELKIFITQFIGAISKDCTISNTIDINFHYHKKDKTLEADASEPLIIYNKKLGYKITYFLSYFKHIPGEVHYGGNFFFTEDTAGLTPKELKKIHQARNEAYLGSRMHFIRSFWANRLDEEGFTIYGKDSAPTFIKTGKTISVLPSYSKQLKYSELVKFRDNQKFINLIKPVRIFYNGEPSDVQTNNPDGLVEIENNGYFGSDISWSNSMGNQRVNVMLPYEFIPDYIGPPKPIEVKDPFLSQLVKLQTAYSGQIKPVEKLYIQTDKPYYTTGDTLRFKGYLLNGDYLTPSVRSGQLYVELDDGDGKATKRIMVPVDKGLAWGDIVLDTKDIPEGDYTLRAYTNWQRNFGEDYIFKKNISIAATKGENLLVTAGFTQKDGKVEGILQFASLDRHIQALKDMQLKVMNGRKNLSKDKLTTGTDGTVKVNFAIPEGARIKDLSIKAQDISKGITNAQELNIPVTVNRMENTDVQFMPEGGKLVAGIKARVGFKAIGEDGKGINITGKITDGKEKEVAKLSTTHAGMGSFEFTPKAGEAYTAKINDITKPFNLPTINPNGTALRVDQAANTDSLQITITTTKATPAATYYLIGQARGVICYAETITADEINNNKQIKRSAAKDQFPTGIARFTLLNQSRQPVNERQVFINQNDNLNITIETDKTNYDTRDSVGLTITVKDKLGKPVQGNFSLAVTDNTQVKSDSLGNNILADMLLTSDLKGNIEEPNYYFIEPEKKEKDLDNLLLTQGWIGYDWHDVLYPNNKLIVYLPEKEFTVNGTVKTAFGNAIEGSNVILVANHPLIFKDTLTNAEGRFTFNNLFPVDTAIYKLQARNKNGKEMNVKIEMDKFNAPLFSPVTITTPWYTNIDSTLFKNTQVKAAQAQAIAKYNGEGKMLQEVVINEKKIIPTSKNLNGPGEADLIIDEKELEKADKMSLLDLLYQKIKGFGEGPFTPIKREYAGGLTLTSDIIRDFPLKHFDDITARAYWHANFEPKYHKPWRLSYRIIEKEVHFIIDGMDLDYFYDDTYEEFPMDQKRYRYIKTYLDYFTAEDITGIELMTSPKYTSNYNIEFDKYKDRSTNGRINTIAYVEITTRSKQGPFMQVVPGTYLYKTLPFSLAKQFYSPKYTVKNKTTALGTDMRSTLYWEPNIVTDPLGRAAVSFFTADKKAGYNMQIEGINNQGELGFTIKKIVNK